MRLGRIDKGIKDACSKVGTAASNAERSCSLGHMAASDEAARYRGRAKHFQMSTAMLLIETFGIVINLMLLIFMFIVAQFLNRARSSSQ